MQKEVVISSSCMVVLLSCIAFFEGKTHTAYLDVGGIPTVCYGYTASVDFDKLYSDEECDELLHEEIKKHAGPVLECTGEIAGNDYVLAAAVSFAYNIGVNAYCRSETAMYFREGDFKTGCVRISENEKGGANWSTVNGKIVRGLINRRVFERKLCERGLK